MSTPAYSVRGAIVRRDDGYVASAEVIPVNGYELPKIAKCEPCEPCSYPQARTACYSYIARLVHAVTTQGGTVVDVMIDDAQKGDRPGA